MLYKTIEDGGGLKVAFSADGIRWNPHSETILPGVFDTCNVALWDGERYAAYVRINQRPRKRYRAVGRTESEDFVHWSVPTIVLKPDERDPEDADLYTSAAFRYTEADSAYFMLPSLFDWRTGQLEPQLATSRDNVNWRRAGQRQAIIPLGAPDSFEAEELMVGAPPVVRGDRILIYYHGDNRPHWGGGGQAFEWRSGIGLATLRLDGFISISADATWGEVRVEIVDDTGAAL
ncbi:MAG: hypothetical protein CML07_08170 [Psychrobacter sp.]|jgi:predicted GH43/DUF377 family glycosyl hydrolase|nr:hypothetical protein [Psychrobacter sp.]